MSINPIQISAVLLGLFGAGCVSAAAPAHAGEWRFHPERCPDLVEDRADWRESRRDERYDRGPIDRIEDRADRADRRESRRDERVTICPKRAWVYHGSSRYRTGRPTAVTVHYDPYEHHYYHYGPNRTGIRIFLK